MASNKRKGEHAAAADQDGADDKRRRLDADEDLDDEVAAASAAATAADAAAADASSSEDESDESDAEKDESDAEKDESDESDAEKDESDAEKDESDESDAEKDESDAEKDESDEEEDDSDGEVVLTREEKAALNKAKRESRKFKTMQDFPLVSTTTWKPCTADDLHLRAGIPNSKGVCGTVRAGILANITRRLYSRRTVLPLPVCGMLPGLGAGATTSSLRQPGGMLKDIAVGVSSALPEAPPAKVRGQSAVDRRAVERAYLDAIMPAVVTAECGAIAAAVHARLVLKFARTHQRWPALAGATLETQAPAGSFAMVVRNCCERACAACSPGFVHTLGFTHTPATR